MRKKGHCENKRGCWWNHAYNGCCCFRYFLPIQVWFCKMSFSLFKRFWMTNPNVYVFKLVRVRRRVEQAAALPPSYSLVSRYFYANCFGHRVFLCIFLFGHQVFLCIILFGHQVFLCIFLLGNEVFLCIFLAKFSLWTLSNWTSSECYLVAGRN